MWFVVRHELQHLCGSELLRSGFDLQHRLRFELWLFLGFELWHLRPDLQRSRSELRFELRFLRFVLRCPVVRLVIGQPDLQQPVGRSHRPPGTG